MPSVSFGAPKNLRYLHPSGLKEMLVHNVDDLEKLNSKEQAARIAASVGRKKRIELLKKADGMKLRVLNPVIQKK